MAVWTYVEHNWSDTSIYKDGKYIATLSIEGEATEDTQEQLEKEMEKHAKLFAGAEGLLIAAQEALSLLQKGAPGWGVAKDLLNKAINKVTV